MNRQGIRRAIEGLRHETNAAERRGQQARQRQEKLLDELEETRLEIRAANQDRDGYIAARDELQSALDADTQATGYAEAGAKAPDDAPATAPASGCLYCGTGPWETHAPGCQAVREAHARFGRAPAELSRIERDAAAARSQPR